jgi:DnaJ-like protein
LSTELGRPYEVLGVKPGVSDRELKAAHRDLAKVWHPDRFQHDPRLQEKAQEKLKEINEAYEQLLSRHKRPFVPRREAAPRTEPAATVRKTSRWPLWVVGPVVLFVLVFAVTTKVLQPKPAEVVELTESPEQIDQPVAPLTSKRTKADPEPAKVEVIEPSTSQPVAAVPTVTVTIDPETGRLATPTCPSRTRMTYPSGSEPREYCNAAHPVKPKDPAIKSLTKRIRSL